MKTQNTYDINSIDPLDRIELAQRIPSYVRKVFEYLQRVGYASTEQLLLAYPKNEALLLDMQRYFGEEFICLSGYAEPSSDASREWFYVIDVDAFEDFQEQLQL